MKEFPLLCSSGKKCRPNDERGPRRTERAWFCEVCIDKLRERLHAIADAWDDLEEALIGEGGMHGEPTTGSKDVGLRLNEKAANARARATADLWAYARIVFEWADENGRQLVAPPSIPGLARWIADWHLDVFVRHVGSYSALAFSDGVHELSRAVRNAAYPSGAHKVETGLRCTEHGTSEGGERVPCVGAMVAWIRPQATDLPDLVCTEDETHTIDPATWQRAGWKRAALNPSGMELLAKRLAQA